MTVPQAARPVVHLVPGSPYSWRVTLALEAKRVAYDTQFLSAEQRELKSDPYLALNPRGRIPTLREGGVVLRESIAIMAYLDERFGAPLLFGTGALERARTLEAILDNDDYAVVFCKTLAAAVLFQPGEPDRAALGKSHDGLERELERLDRELARGGWLLRGAVSAADCALYPFVRFVQRAAGKPNAGFVRESFGALAARWPNVGAWLANVESLAGYERTYPRHWKAAA